MNLENIYTLPIQARTIKRRRS